MDLCRAIGDQKVRVRLVPVKPASPKPLSLADFEVPARLSPADIDWSLSRLRDPSNWLHKSTHPFDTVLLWADRTRNFFDIGFDLDVSTADLTRIFCGSGETEKPEAPKPAEKLPKRAPNRGTKFEAARKVAIELFPNGRPEGLAAKDQYKRIRARLIAEGLSDVSNRTIQRVLQSLNH